MSARRPPRNVSAECLPGAGIPGVCDRCATALPKLRRRWCSDECAESYMLDHIYAWSSAAVMKRDAACVMCGDAGFGETDHIEAALGLHHQHACVHHRDNLRRLCPPCHKQRTAEQRRRPAPEVSRG